jgi:hypothetical protein
MTHEQIHAAATQAGIAPQALAQVVAQTQAHFTGATPRPVDVAQFLASLPVWEKAGIDYAVFEKLHPNTRRDVHRTHNPTPPLPVHSRRPVQDYKPTPEQQTELDAITDRDARVTRYREMRDAKS